jgi:hypothetical protein
MQLKAPQVLAFSAIWSSMTLLSGLPSAAQSSEIRFECDETYNNGKPALVARTPDGTKPIVLWVNSQAGFTPEQRCESAAINFQKYVIQQNMDQIYLVNQEGSPALYARSSEKADERGYLFTLDSWDNDIYKSLQAVPWYVGSPIYQGGQDSFVFNLLSYLKSDSKLGPLLRQ